ncbi:MAG: hypothetical protein U0L51_06810 [Olegusella sp.]|nr:hypothetical protein [Olegusella sp.]
MERMDMYPYDGRFYAQAKTLVRSQHGWMKPLLVLAAAQLVPVIGPLGALGYSLEYARLVAWGVDAAPKQKNVQVGACIKAGWRGLVAGLGATAVGALTDTVLTYLLGTQSSLAGLVSTLIGMFCVTLSCVCAVHASIYQSFRAGYKRRIRDMVAADFRSIVRITCIYMLLCLGVGLVAGIFFSFVIGGMIQDLTSYAPLLAYADTLETMTTRDALGILAQFTALASPYAPGIAVGLYLLSLGNAYTQLMLNLCVGIWFRRFDVPSWRSMDDPLPSRVTPVAPQLPPSR